MCKWYVNFIIKVVIILYVCKGIKYVFVIMEIGLLLRL